MSFGAGAIGQLTFSETTDDGNSISVIPTGVQATFSPGSVTLNSTYFPTGVAATSSVGSVVLKSSYIPTGVASTFALGTATVTGTATVIPTGVQADFAVGTLKLTIWNGVDDSATNAWTVVPTG